MSLLKIKVVWWYDYEDKEFVNDTYGAQVYINNKHCFTTKDTYHGYPHEFLESLETILESLGYVVEVQEENKNCTKKNPWSLGKIVGGTYTLKDILNETV